MTVVALIVLVGCAAAFMAGGMRARRGARPQARLPEHWPLDPRRLLNSQERKVWHWMLQAFPDHHLMVKLAVTRFTLPHRGENSKLLYRILNGVHCTFSVCGSDGRVVGCVDVAGPQGISRVHRHIKITLLSQCGIVYRVIQADSLPKAAELRIDFLGEEAPALFNGDRAAVSHAQHELRAVVERRRRCPDRPAPQADAPARQTDDSSGFDTQFTPSGWQQPNSFLVPLDSRLAGLQ